MKLWLDDIRPPPDDTWTWVLTVEQAIAAFRAGDVEAASLDNDLGEGLEEGRRLVLWMAEHDVWPLEEIAVHSANPVAFDFMCGMIERYSSFKRQLASHRFKR